MKEIPSCLNDSPHGKIPKLTISLKGVQKLQGPDGIPPWFLNRYAYHLTPIIHDIFQSSVDSGQVPKVWNEDLDEKKSVDMAILDFTKAFDKVPHKRLIHKLKYYGITGPISSWIESFLAERTQQVVINGSASKPIKITSRVPQGTVLGPLLFLLYINDLPNNLTSNVCLFADDCLLYQPIKSDNGISFLQNEIRYSYFPL